MEYAWGNTARELEYPDELVNETGLKMAKRKYEEGDLLSTSEAAEVLGITRTRVTTMCRDGAIPCKLIGNRYVIEWKHVKARLENPPPTGRPSSKP